jgi:hypothetical protein
VILHSHCQAGSFLLVVEALSRPLDREVGGFGASVQGPGAGVAPYELQRDRDSRPIAPYPPGVTRNVELTVTPLLLLTLDDVGKAPRHAVLDALQHAPKGPGPDKGIDRGKASPRHRNIEVGVARLGIMAMEQHELDLGVLERAHDLADEALPRTWCARGQRRLSIGLQRQHGV